MHFTYCHQCKQHREKHLAFHDPWEGKYLYLPHKYEPVVHMWVYVVLAIVIVSAAIGYLFSL